LITFDNNQNLRAHNITVVITYVEKIDAIIGEMIMGYIFQIHDDNIFKMILRSGFVERHTLLLKY